MNGEARNDGGPRPRIVIAADAAGVELKRALVDHLARRSVDVVDLGTDGSQGAVDYPDYAAAACEAVVSGDSERGILICGTGIGMSIAANKVEGVRAALCHDTFTAQKSRGHNDANVLALGAWDVTPERAQGIVDAWLGSGYDGGRHDPRLLKIRQLEQASIEPSTGEPTE